MFSVFDFLDLVSKRKKILLVTLSYDFVVVMCVFHIHLVLMPLVSIPPCRVCSYNIICLMYGMYGVTCEFGVASYVSKIIEHIWGVWCSFSVVLYVLYSVVGVVFFFNERGRCPLLVLLMVVWISIFCGCGWWKSKFLYASEVSEETELWVLWYIEFPWSILIVLPGGWICISSCYLVTWTSYEV